MKLKTWIMISYFVVMILPLSFAFLFYQFIEEYNKEQEREGYLDLQKKFEFYGTMLENPAIFQNDRLLESVVNMLPSNVVDLALIDKNGAVIYSTFPTMNKNTKIDKKELFTDLYNIRSQNDIAALKKPVFDNKKIIGFYEFSIKRDKMVKQVVNKQAYTFVLSAIFFIIVYLFVIFLVHKKLTKPLKLLMQQMSFFAAGRPTKDMPAKKDEIGKLISHFNKMRNEIKFAQEQVKKEKQQKQYMIASISHDLKTPLTSIRAYAESLYDASLSEADEKDYIQTIINKSDFIREMIDDLTTLIAFESNEYVLNLKTVESSEFFEMLVESYDEIALSKQIALETSCQVAGKMEVDPTQFTRIADNLVSNAFAHTKANHSVWVGAISDSYEIPSWVFPSFQSKIKEALHGNRMFIVQNEGNGIPKDEREKIFEPLYQIDTSRSQKGTGLGLSIVKKIMEKHGGYIFMLSEENTGSLFACVLKK